MSSGSPQYEFTQEQNIHISGLAHKMGWVGLFFTVVGVLNLIAAIVLLVASFQNKIPSEWVNQVPEHVREEVQKQYEKLPAKHQLWGMVVSSGLSGIIYLLIGIWTRSAASSFRKIVDTRGKDVTLLMDALGSLHSMYSLIYGLLVVTVILILIAVGAFLYHNFF